MLTLWDDETGPVNKPHWWHRQEKKPHMMFYLYTTLSFCFSLSGLAFGLSGVQCVWPAYRARGTKPRWHFIWRSLLWGLSHAAELSGRFQLDELGRGGGKPNKRSSGTISYRQAAQASTKRRLWGSQEAEMKRKARSNLFVVAGTQFFSAGRLKGGTAKWNEKGITLAAGTRRPFLGKRTAVSIWKQILSSFVTHGHKCLIPYSVWPFCYMNNTPPPVVEVLW